MLLPLAGPDNWQQLIELLHDVAKKPPMHDRVKAVLTSLSSYSRILIHPYRADTASPCTILIPSLQRGAP